MYTSARVPDSKSFSKFSCRPSNDADCRYSALPLREPSQMRGFHVDCPVKLTLKEGAPHLYMNSSSDKKWAFGIPSNIQKRSTEKQQPPVPPSKDLRSAMALWSRSNFQSEAHVAADETCITWLKHSAELPERILLVPGAAALASASIWFSVSHGRGGAWFYAILTDKSPSATCQNWPIATSSRQTKCSGLRVLKI